MPMIALREFKEQPEKTLHEVTEKMTEFVITRAGQPVALLLPLKAEQVEQAIIRAGTRRVLRKMRRQHGQGRWGGRQGGRQAKPDQSTPV